MKEEKQATQRELYALLHLSPEASDEEIRKSYRQWAQIYHPDKYQDPQMKDIATENFQRIRDAYEILTDEYKRQIYDIYGFEGLNSGLELGAKLNKPEELKEELERLHRRQEEEKVYAHVRPVGSLLATLSLPQFLSGGSIMRGMQMSSEVQSQISKKNTVVIGGNLAVTGNSGGGAATVLLRHQLSSVSSLEVMASAGLRALIGLQTSRHLSPHSTATTGLTLSLRDGSINLSNLWTRQLSETANGNIQLVLGTENSIGVGWQKKDEKNSAAGEIKFGVGSFGATTHYTRHFSSKSHGRIAGRIGSTALEFEVGGGRKISDFSTVRFLYTIGIQGVLWRVELHRGGQKLIIPVLLSSQLSPLLATGALIVPASLYFLLKKFVVKPYYLKRERLKAQEKRQRTSTQVEEARAAAEKAQLLLKNVANRKKNKQLESRGLVITRSVYGNLKAYKKINASTNEETDELVQQVLDVTVPLNFLINDAGYLKIPADEWFGLKPVFTPEKKDRPFCEPILQASRILLSALKFDYPLNSFTKAPRSQESWGFCDPCPEDPKQLFVEYTYRGDKHEVTVDDYDELIIPQELQRV